MIRKLIVLAITSGLAKKAWDAYKGRNRAGVAASGGTGRPLSSRQPMARPTSADARPDAS